MKALQMLGNWLVGKVDFSSGRRKELGTAFGQNRMRRGAARAGLRKG
jgi:hypothetical protein